MNIVQLKVSLINPIWWLMFALLSLMPLMVLADTEAPSGIDFELMAVADDELDGQRGLANVEIEDLQMVFQSNTSEQNASMKNNQLVSEMTGDNNISGSAFSGMSGIATVIQNTGNQVIIQDTTLLNVFINN